MPRDRLAELRDGTDQITSDGQVAVDIPGGQDIVDMEKFFAEVEEINNGISDVRSRVSEVDQAHAKTLSSVGDFQQDPSKLDALMDSVNSSISKVRVKLKEMETQNRKLGADPSKNNLTSDQRMRLSQHGNLTKKFLEVVTEYQDVQNKYKEKFKDRLQRQFKIVKPDATEEELEKVVDSGSGDPSQIFAQQILMGPQHAEAKKALNDIQERHQDIIKLEKSILELHQLFLDMAVLVDAQGEMINQVEHYVKSAADHTNKGVIEMKKAVENQRASRKKMCCILCLLMTVIIIVIIMTTVIFN